MNIFELSEAKKNQLASEITDRILSETAELRPVDGELLQRFTSFPQVNQFLLFQVYQVWQLQMARFRHSYFDFDHPEVEKQLQVLQNLLSRHITIKPADMKPLLRNAVYNNLSLLANPEESLQNFFFAQMEQVQRGRYASLAPFFHDFHFAVGSIMRYHEKQGLDTVDKDVFAIKLNKVFELYEERGNRLDDYRRKRLEALTGKSLDALMEEDRSEREAEQHAQNALLEQAKERERLEAEKARKAAEAEAEAARAEEDARRQAQEAEARRRQTSFFDSFSVNAPVIELDSPPEIEEPIVEAFADTQAEEISLSSTEEKASEAETPAIADETLTVEVEVPEEVPQAPVKSAEKTVSTIADKLAETRETIADKLKADQSTVADKILKEGKESKTLIERFAGAAEDKEPEEEKPAAVTEEIKETIAEKVEEASEVIAEEVKEDIEEITEDKKEEAADIGGSVLDRFRKKAEETASGPAFEKPKTLADRLREESNGASTAPKTKVAAPLDANGEIIADDIPVHKQYQFVQKVFGGNHARFRAIIEKVNHAEGGSEVEEILEKYVLNNPHVQQGDPVVDEFAGMMRGRF
jgi:hypothetical protein